jgi:sugar phosphate isomerase/epimerase
VDLLAGDSDWPAVMSALDAISYSGWMISEQSRPSGITDAAWLSGLTEKMDEILAL